MKTEDVLTFGTCYWCEREKQKASGAKFAAVHETPDLHPYGPNGANICFDCGSSPEHRAETEANMVKHMTAVFDHAVATGAPVILGQGAPTTGAPPSETMQ